MSTSVTAVVAVVHRVLAAFHGVDLSDDRGTDEAPSKLIWLAVAIGIAIAATTFAIAVFNQAQSGVPDPVAPSPGGGGGGAP